MRPPCVAAPPPTQTKEEKGFCYTYRDREVVRGSAVLPGSKLVALHYQLYPVEEEMDARRPSHLGPLAEPPILASDAQLTFPFRGQRC